MTPEPADSRAPLRHDSPVAGGAGSRTSPESTADDALGAGAEMLARSTRALREAHDPGWDQASHKVLAAVRAATRRSWPVDATFPDDSAVDGPGTSPTPPRGRDRLSVSDQVVISFLRRALERVPSCAPSRISLQLDGHACTGATVSVVAAYGTDLRAAADEVREVVLTALEDLLGPPTFEQRTASVDIAVDDVTAGDPRL